MHKKFVVPLRGKMKKRPNYTKKWDHSPHSFSFKKNDQILRIKEYEIKCYIKEVVHDG